MLQKCADFWTFSFLGEKGEKLFTFVWPWEPKRLRKWAICGDYSGFPSVPLGCFYFGSKYFLVPAFYNNSSFLHSFLSTTLSILTCLCPFLFSSLCHVGLNQSMRLLSHSIFSFIYLNILALFFSLCILCDQSFEYIFSFYLCSILRLLSCFLLLFRCLSLSIFFFLLLFLLSKK